MAPFFSVVISVFNKEKFIQSTLESVLSQTFSDFEIVIVNDGSTDKSENIIKSISDSRIYYFSQNNQGASAGRNAAIARATGTYIALLDADDLWHPHYLETIYELIKDFPEHSVFATAVSIENQNGTYPSTYSIKKLTADGIYVLDYFESSLYNTLLTSSSTVVRSEVFQKIGTYNININSGQDTDLWIKIGLSYQVVFINKTLVTYRYEKKSLSNRSKKINDKPKFDSYLKEEQTNKALKKFMDLNRFSMALLSKLDKDSENFSYYTSGINFENLNQKQRFLLNQPRSIIVLLQKFKRVLSQIGIETSAFR